MKIKIQTQRRNKKIFLLLLVLVELVLVSVLFSSFPIFVSAGVNASNVTVITQLKVGNVFPEVYNVLVEGGLSAYSLVPNDTRTIYCTGVVTDYNGWADISGVMATFFEPSTSTYEAADDNNNHYTNYTCNTTSVGEYNLSVSCGINVWYYANPGTWNCTISANDSQNWRAYGSDLINTSQLLALGLPDTINYGEVNATTVSLENVSNVTNYGNVMFNLSLSGYGSKTGDGNAMNCTLGVVKNISLEYERYNLTTSNPGELGYSEFVSLYTNLTATTAPKIREFNLDYRQNDILNDAMKESYWRIYVPTGVAGNCTGNIVFGATVAPGQDY
jgi:hypothetical protein